MWCGDWSQLPQECLRFLSSTSPSEPFLEEARTLLYTLGNSDDGNSHLVRIACLGPYLFDCTFFSKDCEIWARSAGLYYSRAQLVDSTAEIREAILVMDTLAYHVSLVLVVCSEHGDRLCNGPRFSEKYKNFLEEFDRETIYMNAKTLVESSDIFKLFRKKLTVTVLREDQIQCCFMIALKASIALCNGFLDAMLMYIRKDLQKNSEGTRADELKKAGNDRYNRKMYEEACEYYTKAIAEMRFNHYLYSNRALSALQLQKYRDVEMDARRAIILNPNFDKGYFKVAQVFESQKQNGRAKRVLEYYIKRMELLGGEDVTREVLDLHKKLVEAGQKSKNGKTDNKTSNEMPATNKEKAAVPDLLSDSDSENEAASPAECTSAPPEPEPVARVQTMDVLKKSFEDLLAGLFSVALPGFKTVLSSELVLSELTLVLVEYGAGCALLGMGSLTDLKHSVEYFLGIIQNHKDILFPLAYYGVSKALIKMNRFSEALPHIEKCLSILDRGIQFTETLLWPETKTKVDCAGRAQLQKAMEEMQALCRAPPKWDAMCCLETCHLHRSIYYSDPDFRGFQQLHCASKCLVQYHPSCWREYRESRNLTEKAFLSEVCPTPDCNAEIVKVETIEKDGTLGKQFLLPELLVEAAAKQKKTKKEKKLELREQKKKQRRAAEPPAAKQPSVERDEDGNSVASGGCEPSSASAAAEEVSAERAKPPKAAPKVAAAATANAKPADAKSETPSSEAAGATCEEAPKYDAPYILKKDENAEDELLADGRAKKWKKKRNRPVRVVELDSGDFLYKEYQERIEKLAQIKTAVEEHGDWRSFCQRQKATIPELDPDIPFYIPENLRNNEAALEAVLQHRGGVNDAGSADVDETIYQFFEDLITRKGPLSIHDKLVTDEVVAFPKAAQQAIQQAGGLHNFLMRSLRFTFNGELIYTASMRPRGPSLYTPDEFSDPDEDSDYQEDDEEFEDEEDEEGFQAEAQETGSSQFVETLCHTSATAAASQAGEGLTHGHEDTPPHSQAGEGITHGHEDTPPLPLPAATSSVRTNLNPNAKIFALAIETKEVAPSLPSAAAEPPAASSLATKEALPRPPPKLVALRARVADRVVVAQKLLVGLVPPELADSLVVGLNAFNGPLKPEMLVKVNRGLKHCTLRNKFEVLEVGTQVEEAYSVAEERDSLVGHCDELALENARLKEKLESALDNAAQIQRKHSVENRLNKDRLEEMHTELQNERESFKKTKIEMENEIKKLQVERLKLKEEIKTLKSNRNDDVKNTLERTIAEFTRVKSENQELEETCRTLQEAADSALERAKEAEVRILETAQKWGLERFERSQKQVQKILQEIDNERRNCVMGSPYALDLDRKKAIADQYLQEWSKSYDEFMVQAQAHIAKVENGQALIDLPVLDLPAKPDLELPTPAPRPPLLPLPSDPGVLGARGPFYPSPNMPTAPNSFGSRPRQFGPAAPPLLACPPGLFMPPGLSNGKPSMTEAAAMARPSSVTTGPPPGLGKLGGASISPLAQGDTAAAPHAVGRQDKVRLEATEAPAPKSDKSEKLLLKLLEKYPGCTRDDIKAALHKVHKEIGFKGLTVAEIIKAASDVLDESFSQAAGGWGEGAAAAVGSKPADFHPSEAPMQLPVAQSKVRPILKALRPSQSPVSDLEKPTGQRLQAQKTWATSREVPLSFNGTLHNCSICLEELVGSLKVMKTSCGHSFHEKCLQEWFKKDHTCPICRAHSISDRDFPSLGQ